METRKFKLTGYQFCVTSLSESWGLRWWKPLIMVLAGGSDPAAFYLPKVNNRNTRRRCELCSKLTIKTPEQRPYITPYSGVSIVNFEHVITSWEGLTPFIGHPFSKNNPSSSSSSSSLSVWLTWRASDVFSPKF